MLKKVCTFIFILALFFGVTGSKSPKLFGMLYEEKELNRTIKISSALFKTGDVPKALERATGSGNFQMAKTATSIYSEVKRSKEVYMGPWLVYYGDPQAMLVRVVIDKKCSHNDMTDGSVSVYNPYGKQVTGSPFKLVHFDKTGQKEKGKFVRYGNYPPHWDNTANIRRPQHKHMLEAHLTGLSPDTTYKYVISHSALSKPPTVTAFFKTPPPVGSHNKVVFYATGDNRKYYAADATHHSHFEKVEATMVDDMKERSFVLHSGDAVCMGTWFNYVPSGKQLGWQAEYLYSTDHSDWKKHVWLRANYPTLMSVGNHELKKILAEFTYSLDRHSMYNFCMGNFSRYKPENTLFLTYGNHNPLKNYLNNYAVKRTLVIIEGSFDSQTFFTDWGDLRLICLNTYACYTDTDLTNLKSKLHKWVKGRKAAGKPTIIVLHSPIFWGKDVGEVGYKLNTQQKIRDEIIPYIQDDVNVVISGHTHVTVRTKEIYYDKDKKQISIGTGKGPVYYILGTGGAPDMVTNPSDTETQYCDTLTEKKKKFWGDYAWAKFTVDYTTGKISCDIKSGNLDKNPGGLIDHYEIPFK